jgi:DNA (cytosine-5)-methyltransferase 1
MDGGQQLALALKPLEEMGYKIAEPTIVNAADYGVPQMRQRCFVVGARDVAQAFVFPTKDAKHIPCYKALERPLEGVANNETREHKAASLLRYGQLEYGQRDQLGRVDRLNPLKPSKTVIAGGLKGGGRSHLHPLFPRTLSARESARLQTFPDNYVFTGPSARQFTQIGNAVPPMLAYRMAKAIREQIFEVKRSSVKAVKPAKEFKEPQLAFTL